ncbi:MAG: hypothetical protein QNI96_09245 [Woeseiaceae bacterium]|nr:hypothetical protein [Woeseiaceae bacterium]
MLKIQNNCAQARPRGLSRTLAALVVALLAACHPGAEVTAGAAEEAPVLQCGADGYLSAQLYGAIETRLEWDQDDLECMGMPRPEGRGIRLRLAAVDPASGSELVFIIALPDFGRDSGPAEFDTNTTLIEAGNGRFFSTPNTDNCLVDVESVRGLDEAGERYSIAGTLYCVSPLPEVNGVSSVSVPELRFSGLLDWTAS